MTLRHYRYCGLHLGSDLDLPELPAAPAPDPAPDLVIRRAPVPSPPAPAQRRGALRRLTPDAALWCLEGVARFHVRESGRLIEVEPAPGASAAGVRLFLLHPVFALACVLRGDWLLSAACVAVDGRVVAFAGPSAGGKSSLAAGLATRGHGVLADALLRLTPGPDGPPLAQPQAPWLLLWPDARERLGLAPGQPVRPGIALERQPVETRPAQPLARLAFLHEQRGDAPWREPVAVSGFRALELIARHTAGQPGLVHAEHRLGHLAWARAVSAAVPAAQLHLPWGWRQLDRCLDHVEAWCRHG